MTQLAIDNIPQEEFEDAIAEYIGWAAEWDGALPPDVFFGVWADLQRERRPLEVQARVVANHLELAVPPESPLRVMGNHVYLEDGRELVIQLAPAI